MPVYAETHQKLKADIINPDMKGHSLEKTLPAVEPNIQANESGIETVREALELICDQVELTPYQVVEAIYNANVGHLKQIGELRQVSEITSEEEQDDHFDDLSRIYRQTCLSLGLSWSPPAVDKRG